MIAAFKNSHYSCPVSSFEVINVTPNLNQLINEPYCQSPFDLSEAYKSMVMPVLFIRLHHSSFRFKASQMFSNFPLDIKLNQH